MDVGIKNSVRNGGGGGTLERVGFPAKNGDCGARAAVTYAKYAPLHALAKPHFYHPNPTASNFALKSSQNHDSISTILESFAGSLTFLAFPKADSSPKILESYIALESKDLSLRALAQDKARQSISAQADSKKAQNRETLESYIDSQNHKTRRRRSFFSKSTSSDSTLESTFSQSHDSKSHAHSLSSRDLRQQVVAIHKSAKADSSNAANFTTAKKVDSSKDYSASAECMDCHAIATALARNDKKNAASKKVDSRSEAQNLKTPAKDSGIFDKTAQSVFDSHTTGGRIFLKKHRRNLSGVPCFDTNAELQKVDSSPNAHFSVIASRDSGVAIHKGAKVDSSKQATNVSKQPKDSKSEAQNLKTPAKDSRILEIESGLFKRVQRRILGVCNCSTRAEIADSSPKPAAAVQGEAEAGFFRKAESTKQKPTPKPKPQRLPL
ncbi:hypothetical protein [Helicobacter canis]|uniref:hypothetical protein n=1 Tax=Helicobacter canis TaxID=29419 RepID=UPI000E0F0FE8|nr:hypothetical protein [Helicobacter canis]